MLAGRPPASVLVAGFAELRRARLHRSVVAVDRRCGRWSSGLDSRAGTEGSGRLDGSPAMAGRPGTQAASATRRARRGCRGAATTGGGMMLGANVFRRRLLLPALLVLAGVALGAPAGASATPFVHPPPITINDGTADASPGSHRPRRPWPPHTRRRLSSSGSRARSRTSMPRWSGSRTRSPTTSPCSWSPPGERTRS